MLGSFLLVFVYLTQTEEGYKLSNDPAITTMIISGCYVVAMRIGISPKSAMQIIPSQNPAVSLGMMTAAVFDTQKTQKFDGMSWAWIYLVFPWVGAILAVIIYELLFKKAQDVVQERQEEVDAEAHLMEQQ